MQRWVVVQTDVIALQKFYVARVLLLNVGQLSSELSNFAGCENETIKPLKKATQRERNKHYQIEYKDDKKKQKKT